MSDNKSNEVKSFFDQTHIYLHKDFGVSVRAEIAWDLLADRIEGKRVIDVGCGNGDVTLRYLDKVEQLDYLDISDKMLELVKSKVPENMASKVAFFNCDLEQLDVTKKYDIIVAYGLIMHVNSPFESLKKMSELLEPGGLLLTQYTNYSHPISRFNKFLRRERNYSINKIDKKIFKDLTSKLGFKVLKSFSYSWMVSGLGFLPTSVLYKFHKWTYKNKFVGSLGMDDVYLLTK